MEDELRTLNEALIMKSRLRVLADVQASYLHELAEQGVEAGIAEQLLLDWSRQAFGMTFRSLPDPVLDLDLDALLGRDTPAHGAQPPRPPVGPDAAADDPSTVPTGEPWLQLVQEHEAAGDLSIDDLDVDGRDERAA
ncbi:MAG: hypothetical protein H7287_03870 [Thermoleophilia bacterium]|nr:hypothetical protein [Thermoleophilia bacterium]